MSKILIPTLLLMALAPGLQAQVVLTGIATRWSDSFREWSLYTDNEAEEGELRLRWSTGNDWTEWDYRIGDYTGQIRLKWRNDPNEWEVRGQNQIVTARTIWNGDFREWRVTGPGGRQFVLKSRYANILDQWELRSDQYGYFEIYTNLEGDPRDWIIVDELEEAISLPEKMTLIFIAVFHSTPKD